MASNPKGETRFSHPAVVVCESPDLASEAAVVTAGPATAQDARPIVCTLHLDATHDPAVSPPIHFSFRPNATTEAPCLQLSPDCLSSLTRTVYNHTHAPDDPPHIHLVRAQLGNTLKLVRLRFRLHRHGRLVPLTNGVLADWGDPSLNAFASFTTASAFSAYMPDRALTKTMYTRFFKAVQPFIQATLRGSNTSVDQRATACSPPAYAPPPAESDNDTVAVTTPSGFGSPPHHRPPGYTDDESESSCVVAAPFDDGRKRHTRNSSGEDSSVVRGKKRARWSAQVELVVETDSPTPPAIEGDSSSRLDALEARILRLERENRTLKRRNAELELRVEELDAQLLEVVEEAPDEDALEILEARVHELEEQQTSMEETLDRVDVRQHEVDEDYDRLALKLQELEEELDDRIDMSIDAVLSKYRAELKDKFVALLQD